LPQTSPIATPQASSPSANDVEARDVRQHAREQRRLQRLGDRVLALVELGARYRLRALGGQRLEQVALGRVECHHAWEADRQHAQDAARDDQRQHRERARAIDQRPRGDVRPALGQRGVVAQEDRPARAGGLRGGRVGVD
jgi:hypothetical protein